VTERIFFCRYRVLDERDLIKYKGLVVKKWNAMVLVLFVCGSGLLRVILIATGESIIVAFRVWNVIITLVFFTLSFSMVINGWRLRRKVKKMMHKSGGTKKLTLMMIGGNLLFSTAGISLLLWISIPNLFGMLMICFSFHHVFCEFSLKINF
jgi:hypothetical protein